DRPTHACASALVREEFLDATAAALDGTTVVALTADLAGRGSHDLGRALSYARVVPSMGDVFQGGPDPGDALAAGGESATMARLLEGGGARGGRAGGGARARARRGRRGR